MIFKGDSVILATFAAISKDFLNGGVGGEDNPCLSLEEMHVINAKEIFHFTHGLKNITLRFIYIGERQKGKKKPFLLKMTFF